MKSLIPLIVLGVIALICAMSLLSFVFTAPRGRVVRARKFRARRFNVIERMMLPFVLVMGLFASWWHRVWWGGDRTVALANTLGLINEHGIESLLIDPNQSLPVATRYLMYERGATGAQYCQVAAGTNPPLGASSDSPYQVGDVVNIRRLGVRPGLELGIPGGAITIDHLICVAKDGSGKVLDLTLQGNGTYWVIGRACQTVAATDIEVAFAPDVPYQITVSNGGGTYAYAGAGV